MRKPPSAFKFFATTLFGLFLAALMTSARAQTNISVLFPNLITNGNFTLTNAIANPSNPAGSNGGMLNYNINATGWVNTPATNSINLTNGGGTNSIGYNFLYTPTSTTNGGAVYGNSGTGSAGLVALYNSFNGGVTNSISPTYISAPPTNAYFTNAGNFIAADGAYQVSAIQQTLTNLVRNQQYLLTFYWGAAQQTGFSGGNSSQWTVSLGRSSNSTSVLTNSSAGFAGWQQSQFRYTATNTTMILSFLATGTPNGQPPFALLGNVSLVAVPEASTVITGLLLLSFVCAGTVFKLLRKRSLDS